jgi:hypothetical protein
MQPVLIRSTIYNRTSIASWAGAASSQLILLAVHPARGALTGIVDLESSACAPGRYNDFLHHPAMRGGES